MNPTRREMLGQLGRGAVGAAVIASVPSGASAEASPVLSRTDDALYDAFTASLSPEQLRQFQAIDDGI